MVKNYRALNILFYGLDSNEFKHVFALDIAKEVWDIWETTYDGACQVQKFKNQSLCSSI